ncbi:MAG: hypothetical protein H5U17_08820 [Defluviimonas sp.]|nr:hypothetical protein [Defluviimonas sp.]
MANRKFRWSKNGGTSWTYEDRALPYTLPGVTGSDAVLLEPIGTTASLAAQPAAALALVLDPAAPRVGDTVTVTGTISGGTAGDFVSISAELDGTALVLSGSGMSRSFTLAAAGTLILSAAVLVGGQPVTAALGVTVAGAAPVDPPAGPLAFTATPAPTGTIAVGAEVRAAPASVTGGTAPYVETIGLLKNGVARNFLAGLPVYQFVPADQGATYVLRRTVTDSLGATVTHDHTLGTVGAGTVGLAAATQTSLGDSITLGLSHGFLERWVNLHAYATGVPQTLTAADVANFGVNGQAVVNDGTNVNSTTPGRNTYLQATGNTVPRYWNQSPANNRRSEALTVAWGVNDIRNTVTNGFAREGIEGDLIEVLHGLTVEPAIGYDPAKVLVMGTYPVTLMKDATEADMAWMLRAGRRVAQRFGTRFSDPYSGYRDPAQGYMSLLSDGVHPSPVGHGYIGDLAARSGIVTTPLPAPTGVTVTPGADTYSASVSWSAVAGADGYEVIVLGRWGEEFDIRRAWSRVTGTSVTLANLRQCDIVVYVSAAKGEELSVATRAMAHLPGPDDLHSPLFSGFWRPSDAVGSDAVSATHSFEQTLQSLVVPLAGGTTRLAWNMLLGATPLVNGASYRIHYDIATVDGAGAPVSSTMQIRGGSNWGMGSTGAQTIRASSTATSWAGTADFTFASATPYIGPVLSSMAAGESVLLKSWWIEAL